MDNQTDPKPAQDQMQPPVNIAHSPPQTNQTARLQYNPQPVDTTPKNTPGLVILGWLSYAFWGWLILAMIWSVWVVAANAITGDGLDNIVQYALAATLVLLPIAFVTDFFYRRQEPTQKGGAMMIVMVIHAVIFALFGIGFLISAVFTAISVFIGEPGSNDYQIVWIITGLIASVLYAMAFLRTLNPLKTKKLAAIYGYVMLGIAAIITLSVIVGPLMRSVSLRDDRRIESSLDDVNRSVENHVSNNQKLPEDLKQVNFVNDGAKSLVDDNLVVIKVDSPESGYLRYQLCATYIAAASNRDSYRDYSEDSMDSDDAYKTYLSTYNHSKGQNCYKLKVKDPSAPVRIPNQSTDTAEQF